MDREYRDGYNDGREKGEEQAYCANKAYQEAWELWREDKMTLQTALSDALADAARLSMALRDLHATCITSEENITVCICLECARARKALERHDKGD